MHDPSPPKKRHIGRIIFLILASILSLAGIFLYRNFNHMLSDALLKNFNSNIISDVYELKFEKLSINFLEGNIQVLNVDLQPREKPLQAYPYINSSLHLTTKEMSLVNVKIIQLLRTGLLDLDKILINKPHIDLTIEGVHPILFPFNDTTNTVKIEQKKRNIDSFKLSMFQLIDANFHVNNSLKNNEFTIQNFNITLNKLSIHQFPGKDVLAVENVELSLGNFIGNMQKEKLRYLGFKDFHIKVEDIDFQKTLDTMIYRFSNFDTGLSALEIQTADSIFHISLSSFNLSYKDQNIRLRNIRIKPNVSDAELQKKYQYQHAQAYGSVGSLEIQKINFDSLIFHRKLYIDQILLDSVSISIYKDKLKPINTHRFPPYPAQQIAAIKMPIKINRVNATHVNLTSTERKPDSTTAKVNINRATLEVTNITNLSAASPLVINADARIEGTAHFNATLKFNYAKPQFSFKAKVSKFDLKGLNPLIKAYTPASVHSGTVDELNLAGVAEHTKAGGSMTFLYHDLNVDLELQNKAKWKSSVIAFAANSILPSSNPASEGTAPRTVKFTIERDMNKAFINVLIKSVLNGLKETMVMSKENKKAHKAALKKQRQVKNK
ncbi:MAG: DUF748 domain-containing protein [bacterium]|nr:DUF748 domain-containing protein [bacterium]